MVGRATGEGRRSKLGLVVNRDPARFTAGGRIHPDTLDAYWRCGLRVFEGVPRPEGLADIEADLRDTLGRLPAERGSPVDARGRPAVGADNQAPALFWSKPLGDPFERPTSREDVRADAQQGHAEGGRRSHLGSLQLFEAALRAMATRGSWLSLGR